MARLLMAFLFGALMGLAPSAPASRVYRVTGGFTYAQVVAMPTAEKEWRFAACTNEGDWGLGTPVPGWDSSIDGDTTYYYRIWLHALLWPEDVPTDWLPPTYCSSFSLAAAGAYRVGIALADDDTATTIVIRVLCTVGHD